MTITSKETFVETMSVYELGYTDGVVTDLNGKRFHSEVYSRFKYGDGEAVDHYATLLAEQLLDKHGDRIAKSYIAGSASKNVPTAAEAISRELLGKLTLMGCPPAGAFRIDRAVVRTGDYSALPEEERTQLTASNGLRLPEVALNEVKDSPLLVVDDIRVTGSHEHALRRVLGDLGLKNTLFTYIASVDPKVAAEYPQVEHLVNHAYVKGLSEIVDLVESPNFVLNARTCKFILQSEPQEIVQFVKSIPPARARHILSSMVADGYHKMPTYAESFAVFADTIPQRIDRYTIYDEVLFIAAGAHAFSKDPNNPPAHHDTAWQEVKVGRIPPFRREIAYALEERTSGKGEINTDDIESVINYAVAIGTIRRTRRGYWELTRKGRKALGWK